jgi:hypothetical protein
VSSAGSCEGPPSLPPASASSPCNQRSTPTPAPRPHMLNPTLEQDSGLCHRFLPVASAGGRLPAVAAVTIVTTTTAGGWRVECLRNRELSERPGPIRA